MASPHHTQTLQSGLLLRWGRAEAQSAQKSSQPSEVDDYTFFRGATAAWPGEQARRTLYTTRSTAQLTPPDLSSPADRQSRTVSGITTSPPLTGLGTSVKPKKGKDGVSAPISQRGRPGPSLA